jgi:DNA-binding transcriptional LysR family regulator
MDIDDIRLFAKVAELKSFVKAATELRIQTSLLSRRVARLEATLGVRLLQRTTRRVSLTEEGARFYFETTRGLDQLHSAVDSLNSLHGVPKGKVRVSSPIEIGQFLVENAMSKFYSTYPDIQIEWDLLSATKSLIESGTDLTIRVGRSDDQQSLIEKKIGTLNLRLYRSPDFPFKLSKRPSMDELERLPWLVFTRGLLDSQRVKLPLRLRGEELEIYPKNIRFRTNSLMSIRYAIVQGNGIGLLPPQVSAPEVAAGRLVLVNPNFIDGPPVDVYAAYPTREYLAPKIRVLIDWLSKNFPKTN